METTNVHQTKKTTGKGALWAGRVITVLCVLFLLVDGGMKVVKSVASMEGSVELGWPESAVQPIGIMLVICTLLYIIPRTSILGAILLTGYLGCATSVLVSARQPGHPYFLPGAFSVLGGA